MPSHDNGEEQGRVLNRRAVLTVRLAGAADSSR
jgi:hypothetical protein